MDIRTEPLMGALGALLDPDGPTVRVAQFTKAELLTLRTAAAILERLRDTWTDDQEDVHPIGTDVAMAMYTIRELVEDKGRVEL